MWVVMIYVNMRVVLLVVVVVVGWLLFVFFHVDLFVGCECTTQTTKKYVLDMECECIDRKLCVYD